MDFDRAYGNSDAYFGELPERSLVAHVGVLDPSRPVLDIGCGQGRNALWLARRGFTVHALDPSPVALETVSLAARAEDLPIHTFRTTLEEFQADLRRYGGILIFGLIPILRRSELLRLANDLEVRTAPGVVVWLTAFTTEDPAYPRIAETWHEEESGSFRSSDGTLRTYLEPGELSRLLASWTVLHLWEGLGPRHRHAGGPPERHGISELVVRKPGGGMRLADDR